MIGILRWRALACALLGGIVLAACGGGGGGGGSEGLSIRFSSSQLEFSGVQGEFIPAQSVGVTASGDTQAAVYVGAEIVEGNAIQLPINITIDTVSRTAQVSIAPRNDLPAGTHRGRVRLLACADAACSRHHGGSPFELGYRIEVAARLEFPAGSPVALAAAETALSEERLVAVQLPAAGTALAVQVQYLDGTGWLTAQQATDGLKLRASAAGLPPGLYQARVQVSGGQPQQTAALLVQFTVSQGLVVPAEWPVALTSTTPAAALAGSVPVTAAPGVPDARWTATSAAPWLVLTRTAGTAGEPLTFTLDLTRVAALANGQTHAARVTVASPAGLAARVLDVMLSKDLAEAEGIDALALLAGRAGDVLLYGRFDALADPAAHVQVTGATPLSVQRLGAGVLKLRMAALAEGPYAVTMSNLAGLPTRTHTLRVLPARSHAYASVATEGGKGPLAYDPVTRAVFMVNRSLSSLMRFGYDGAQWTVSARPMSGIASAGLTVDRNRLVSLVQPNSVVVHDPVTLQPQASFTTMVQPAWAPLTIGPAFTGDGRLWLSNGLGGPGLLRLDIASGEQQFVVPPPLWAAGGWANVSADGRRLLYTQTLSLSPAPPMLSHDVATGAWAALETLPYRGFARISQSRDGSRIALETMEMFDESWQTLGRITLPAPWIALRTMLSRDGSRAYVYAVHENTVGEYAEPTNSPLPRVFVLDTSQPMVTALSFPVLDFVELADHPSCRVNQGGCEPYGAQAVLADDDRTVFVAGDRRFIVQPIPAPLQPASAFAARAKPAATLRRLQ